MALVIARSEGDASGPEHAVEGERATMKALPTALHPPSPLRDCGDGVEGGRGGRP